MTRPSPDDSATYWSATYDVSGSDAAPDRVPSGPPRPQGKRERAQRAQPLPLPDLEPRRRVGSAAKPGGAGETDSADGLAIAALICAFLIAPIGIILGTAARKRIRAGQGQGESLATAAIIVGWVLTGLGALWILLQLIALAALASAVS